MEGLPEIICIVETDDVSEGKTANDKNEISDHYEYIERWLSQVTEPVDTNCEVRFNRKKEDMNIGIFSFPVTEGVVKHLLAITNYYNCYFAMLLAISLGL